MAVKDICGKVYVVGDDVNTDFIIPAVYLVTTDPKELALHAMEGLDKSEYPVRMLNEDGSCDYRIIISGKNFGCGSSREHAAIALFAAGIEAIVAPTFARIFYRNCINGGQLYSLATDDEDIKEMRTGDECAIHIDPDRCVGIMYDADRCIRSYFDLEPLPEFVQQIYEDGGLMPYSLKKMQEAHRIPEFRRCAHH